jgi:hypothetical protein
VFTISRTGSTASALTVQLHGIAGTADPGNDKDYTPLVTSVTIPAGKSSVTLEVIPRPDGLTEDPESVVVYVKADDAYLVASPKEATVTIQDGGRIDIGADSANDGTIAEADDPIEADADRPGKIVAVNDDDTDGDGIPDFADGYNLDGGHKGGRFGRFSFRHTHTQRRVLVAVSASPVRMASARSPR